MLGVYTPIILLFLFSSPENAGGQSMVLRYVFLPDEATACCGWTDCKVWEPALCAL